MHSDLLEMGRMRVLLAIALLGFGIAGVGAARAADLSAGHSTPYSGRYFEHAQHSEMLWLYDDQPGVVVRAYWEAPWRYHHYFPATGIAPRIGRYENLSAVSHPPKPAKTFRRSWSNAWAVKHLYAASAQPLATQADSQADTQPDTQPGARRRPHAHGSHRMRIR
jgi:hypothetical protein